jgi:hypothetical protein
VLLGTIDAQLALSGSIVAQQLFKTIKTSVAQQWIALSQQWLPNLILDSPWP